MVAGLSFPRGARDSFIAGVNTFDRHLLREWLSMLGLVLAVTCGLLLVQVMYDKFPDLRENGAEGWELWKNIGVAIPSFFAVVLPLALLISLLYTLGKLHRANELTALRAAGVGFGRMMAPIWVVGALCCGVMWWLNTGIVPWSVEQSRAMEEQLQFRREMKTGVASDRVGVVESVTFDNRLARRMWFFNRYSRGSHRGYGVQVSELDPRRRDVRRLLAAQAWYDPARDGWVFKDGRELLFDVETGEQLSSQPFAERFESTFKEKPDLMLLIDRKASHMSLYELRALIDHHEVERSPKVFIYAVRYFGLIADTLAPLIVIAIAIPFAISGVRVNPAVGVSKSIGLFFLYYILTNVASSLAAKQILDPVVAAWLPNAGMAALAAWLFARLR